MKMRAINVCRWAEGTKRRQNNEPAQSLESHASFSSTYPSSAPSSPNKLPQSIHNHNQLSDAAPWSSHSVPSRTDTSAKHAKQTRSYSMPAAAQDGRAARPHGATSARSDGYTRSQSSMRGPENDEWNVQDRYYSQQDHAGRNLPGDDSLARPYTQRSAQDEHVRTMPQDFDQQPSAANCQPPDGGFSRGETGAVQHTPTSPNTHSTAYATRHATGRHASQEPRVQRIGSARRGVDEWLQAAGVSTRDVAAAATGVCISMLCMAVMHTFRKALGGAGHADERDDSDRSGHASSARAERGAHSGRMQQWLHSKADSKARAWDQAGGQRLHDAQSDGRMNSILFNNENNRNALVELSRRRLDRRGPGMTQEVQDDDDNDSSRLWRRWACCV